MKKKLTITNIKQYVSYCIKYVHVNFILNILVIYFLVNILLAPDVYLNILFLFSTYSTCYDYKYNINRLDMIGGRMICPF